MKTFQFLLSACLWVVFVQRSEGQGTIDFDDHAPFIVRQPQSRSVETGADVTFNPTVLGKAPFFFQWLKDGEPIEGATNWIHTVNHIQLSDAGNYAFVVSNDLGVAVSSDATLTVLLSVADALDAPEVSWSVDWNRPWFGQTNVSHDGVGAAQSSVLTNSQSSSIYTVITGPSSLSFWWKVSSEEGFDFLNFSVDGVEKARISGETDWRQQSLSIPSGTHTLRWTYSKDASVDVGQDTAWLDQVVFQMAPTITAQPQNRWVSVGDSAVFSVAARGTGPLSYQWRRNGLDLAGATGSTYDISHALTNDGGLYSVIVSNAYGSVFSSKATLTVVLPLAEALDTTNVIWTTSGSLKWFGQKAVTHDGVDAAEIGSGGDYYSSGTMETTITGPGRLSFWWKISHSSSWSGSVSLYFNGIHWTSISGMRNWQQAQFMIPPGTHSLRWVYERSYYSSGNAWVDEVVFTPQEPSAPAITTQPASQNALQGNVASFSVVATGHPPPAYQWYFNESQLEGETNSNLSLSNVATNHVGNYSVVVSNAVGQVTSSNASLSIIASNGLRVLLIWNVNSDSDAMTSLKSALESAGTSVTLSDTSEAEYDGSNPSPDGFHAVIHLNGTAFGYHLPLSGQNALLNFVHRGGGLVGNRWHPFQSFYLGNVRDLILFDSHDAGSGDFALNIVPERSTHPVLANISSNFQFFGAFNVGTAHAFTPNPVMVLMRDAQGNDAVAVREFGSGRVVGFQFDGNWGSPNPLTNVNVQRLYINAVNWAAGVLLTNQPPVIKMQPQSQTVSIGSYSYSTFTTAALGAPPFAYQWRINGTTIEGATDSSFSIFNALGYHAGDYSVVVSNAFGVVISSNATLTVVGDTILSDALDNSLVWSRSGNWFPTSNTTRDGIDALQIGPTSGYEYSSMESTVVGPGTVSFWCKASLGDQNYFNFYIDGHTRASISSGTNWESMSFYIPAGVHSLSWVYQNSGSFDWETYEYIYASGTVWIDQVVFSPSQPIITFQHTDHRLAAWYLNGTSLAKSEMLNGNQAVSPQWQLIGTGDLNNDGAGDLIWQNENRILAVWLMNQGHRLAAFQLRQGRSVAPGWHLSGTGDLNNDTQDDFLWRHDDGRLAVWIMNGTEFGYAQFIVGGAPVDPLWKIVGLTDFDFDGKTDFLWENVNRTLSVWLMDGLTMRSNFLINDERPTTPGWQIVGVSDSDGNGTTDIFWQHDDRRLAVWFMNGTQRTSARLLRGGVPAAAGWRALGVR